MMNSIYSGSKPGGSDAKWFAHFQRTLDSLHDSYIPEIRMLRCPFTSPGYHTSIKKVDFIHPTRQTTDYALALLDGGDSSYRQRAFDIIGEIIALQDQNPESPTYGIWSWFWDEPLSRMSPPDWNWADFIGKRLVHVLIRHGSLFPAELRKALEECIGHCCESIIRRNVGPEYTNIAIMGTFVTLIGGETLQVNRYKEYGIDRLQRLHRYTMASGTFQEYNSPPYGVVSIIELSGLVHYVEDDGSRKLAKELLELTWSMAAEHFHPVLKEWSGPHARSYGTFLSKSQLSFLTLACDGKAPLIGEDDFVYDLEWFGNGIRCPDEWVPLFLEPGTKELLDFMPVTHEHPRKSAYTYMTPTWTLGTFNHGIMWNQCRNLLAFAGRGSDNGSYVRLRVLHDGYDYCSAVYMGKQKGGSALFGIRFTLDGGGTHPNLDPVNGRIRAADFRIRLEIGYKGERPVCRNIDPQTGMTDFPGAGITMHYQFLHGEMSGSAPFRLQTVKEQSVTGFDIVLHQGEPAIIDFNQLEKAVFLFALTFTESPEAPVASVHAEDRTVTVTLGTGKKAEHLELKMGNRPLCRLDLFHESLV